MPSRSSSTISGLSGNSGDSERGWELLLLVSRVVDVIAAANRLHCLRFIFSARLVIIIIHLLSLLCIFLTFHP